MRNINLITKYIFYLLWCVVKCNTNIFKTMLAQNISKRSRECASALLTCFIKKHILYD